MPESLLKIQFYRHQISWACYLPYSCEMVQKYICNLVTLIALITTGKFIMILQNVSCFGKKEGHTTSCTHHQTKNWSISSFESIVYTLSTRNYMWSRSLHSSTLVLHLSSRKLVRRRRCPFFKLRSYYTNQNFSLFSCRFAAKIGLCWYCHS